MDETRTRTERYTGPSAGRIADLLPHRVSFEKGWFWTAAVCHGAQSDGLAFRQRPDGNGIEVRCHTQGLRSGRGDNRAGGARRAAHLDGLRARLRRAVQGT